MVWMSRVLTQNSCSLRPNNEPPHGGFLLGSISTIVYFYRILCCEKLLDDEYFQGNASNCSLFVYDNDAKINLKII
jgi:hypothetical protein